jgi:hypothetical protein
MRALLLLLPAQQQLNQQLSKMLRCLRQRQQLMG